MEGEATLFLIFSAGFLPSEPWPFFLCFFNLKFAPEDDPPLYRSSCYILGSGPLTVGSTVPSESSSSGGLESFHLPAQVHWWGQHIVQFVSRLHYFKAFSNQCWEKVTFLCGGGSWYNHTMNIALKQMMYLKGGVTSMLWWTEATSLMETNPNQACNPKKDAWKCTLPNLFFFDA